MRWNILTIVVFCPVLLIGCGGPTGDVATGENTQLRQRIEQAEAEVARQTLSVNKMQEENTRLQAQLAAVTGGKSMTLEEMQKLLDTRKATLDKREQDSIARETSVESQLTQRREEMQRELANREEAVLKREQEILLKENDFYKATNLDMKDIGEAQFIKKEFENMRSARDDAIVKADKWLQFMWGVSIAFGIAIIACITLGVITYSKHLAASRELKTRQEVARLLGTAIKAQLPPEQGALVVDAFNRLSQVELQRVTGRATA